MRSRVYSPRMGVTQIKPARQADVSTVLTWYCGLYQCFRSQSHRIIWNTKNKTSNVSWMQTLCIYTCRNAFYMEGAQILLLQRFFSVFTEGTARSDTGCQPLVHAAIWKHTVATVYFEDFLDCVVHVRLQVCTPPRQWQTVACDWQGKKKRKPLKQPRCVYNGAVRSYLATATSIGSISALSAGNLTPHSNVWSRLRNARVPERVEFERKNNTCDRWWWVRLP